MRGAQDLTWYVLSKLSYMNRVIRDVFPTVKQEEERGSATASELGSSKHTSCEENTMKPKKKPSGKDEMRKQKWEADSGRATPSKMSRLHWVGCRGALARQQGGGLPLLCES